MCTSALVALIDGMARIDRPAIDADRGIVAARLDELLRRVMAALAQALQGAEAKFGVVAFVWGLVIDDGRGCEAAFLGALLA